MRDTAGVAELVAANGAPEVTLMVGIRCGVHVSQVEIDLKVTATAVPPNDRRASGPTTKI